jgi:hypothetical protein
VTVQLASSPRRALGLLAVGTIGMSTALFSVTGVATAATTSSTFTTASGMTQLVIVADPFADCTVDFTLHGAGGGSGVDADGSSPAGSKGGHVTGTSSAINGDRFDLFAGGLGGNGGDGAAGIAGTNAAGYTGQAGYTNGTDIWGGGGGGASTVARTGDSVILGAFGGNGALSQLGNGVGGNAGANILHADGVTLTPSNTGAGVISGTVTCVTGDPVAPGAPTLDDYVNAGDGTAKFWFTPGTSAFDGNEQQVTVSYEYRLDGGDWTAFTTGNTGSDKLTGTLTDLTNLKKYSLVVRATSAAGNSPASAPVEFTPFRPTAAPASVSASVGVTSVRISWTPPADAAGVVDYVAFATPDGAQSNQDTVVCETTATSCTVAAKAGLAYGFGVASRDALGNEGDRIFGENPTAVVPASAISATLPKANGALTSSDADGKVVAGTQVTISGKDFLPGSTVDLIVYSTPVKLGEAVVASDGTFSATVTLPTTLANGVHHLVASGVDVNGNVRNLVVEVTVSGGTAVLANTGFSTLPYLGTGALALLAGGGLLVAARRRSAA